MRLQRDALLPFGAALAGVGVALCIAEGGGHPLRKLWFLVGIGCLLVGFRVLAAAALERALASVPHDQQLRMMLGGARSSIEGELGCPFADPARNAAEGGSEEFHAPLPPPDQAPRAMERRDGAPLHRPRWGLLAKLTSESEGRLPGTPTYRVDVIAKDLGWIIMRRALNDRLCDPLSFEPDATGEVWTGCSLVKLPPADGLRLARDRDWAISMLGVPEGPVYERAFQLPTKPVNELLTDALRWPETIEVKDSYRDLLAFDRGPLLRKIGKLESETRFRRKRRCPLAAPAEVGDCAGESGN